VTCECEKLETPRSKKWHYRRGMTPCPASFAHERPDPKSTHRHFVNGERVTWTAGSSIFVPEYEAP
jgi:hypothetical protein